MYNTLQLAVPSALELNAFSFVSWRIGSKIQRVIKKRIIIIMMLMMMMMMMMIMMMMMMMMMKTSHDYGE